MIDNSNKAKTVLATITSAADTGPRGGKRLRLGFRTEDSEYLTLCLAPRFSSRSGWGKAFLASTGIKPSDLGGLDPIALMVGKLCYLHLEPQTDGDRPKISRILPLPSPQLKLDWES